MKSFKSNKTCIINLSNFNGDLKYYDGVHLLEESAKLLSNKISSEIKSC